MLTKYDLCERLGLDLETIAYLHCKKITPEPVIVGGEHRWRVEDIELFEEYLLARREFSENGGDPDGASGPSPPVYSMGHPAFDPREETARIRERERQAKSKTLAAGSKPIPAEKPVALPATTSTTTKVEG
jgi:hypothetical protein